MFTEHQIKQRRVVFANVPGAFTRDGTKPCVCAYLSVSMAKEEFILFTVMYRPRYRERKAQINRTNVAEMAPGIKKANRLSNAASRSSREDLHSHGCQIFD